MPDIGVEPRSLRAAAKGTRELADELRTVDPRVADPIARAMPGSGAAKHAAQVGDLWQTRLAENVSSLEDRATKLAEAADTYDGGERAGEADFSGLTPAET